MTSACKYTRRGRDGKGEEWERLTPADNFIFSRIMQNVDVCRKLLELLLKRKITRPGGNTGLKEARMIVEIIVAVVTCATSVINTILAALSYLKGKDKE